MSVDESTVDDDFDPLAPVLYESDEDASPAVTDSPSPFGVDVADEDDPVEPADGGVSDGDNIVRVWLEDGRLTKVRVSVNWAQRLGRRSLSDAFRQALSLANAHVADVPEPTEPDFSAEVDFSDLPPFTNRAFSVMQQLFADVETRWDSAIERYNSRPKVPHVPVEGKSKGVTVGLAEDGRADRVSFDDKWLETAQAGQICQHVQQAAELAYARYTPQRDDRSELEAIEEEHALLTATFKAMLNPKER